MSGSHLCIPRNETGNRYFQNRIIMFCLPVPTLIYLWEIYIFPGKYVDLSWEYINHSQTHECGNWDWGHAIPRKGIHKWDFPCSVGTILPAAEGCQTGKRGHFKKPSFSTAEVDKKYIFPAGARHTISRFTYNAVNIRSRLQWFSQLDGIHQQKDAK